MDYEDVVNFNRSYFNDTANEILDNSSYGDLAHEILFGLCCTAAFFADIFIVYTILYFKQLRTTSNMLIVNWAILDIATLLVTPSGYELLSVIDHLPLSKMFYCQLFQLGSALHYSLMLFVFIVLIDWSFAAYFHRVSNKIRMYYKFVIGFSWLIALILSIVYIKHCSTRYFFDFFNFVVLLITFFIMIIYIVTVHCIRAVQKCRRRPLEHPTVSLNLVTAFVSCYILGFINIILVEYYFWFERIFATIGACAIFCNSILNLILLYVFDKDFKMYFLQVLRCKCKKYESQINETENQRDDFMVQVSFHRPTEELLSNEY